MNNKKNTVFLPLWSWAIVAAIMVFILVVARPIAAMIEDQKYSNAVYLNLTRLAPLEHPRSIIALGTSLTHRAFDYDDEMQQRLKEHGVTNRFVRITASAAGKSSLEGALPAILASSPGTVLIELEMLIVDRSSKLNAARYTLMQNINIIYAWLKKTLFGIEFAETQDVFPDNFGLNKTCKQKYNSANQYPQIAELPQSHYKVYKEFLSQPWRDFIAGVAHQGGQVIILEMGRSSYAGKGFTPNFLQDYETNLQKLKGLPPLILWRFPGPFTLDNYCDLAHLNAQGSAHFMNWIMPHLRSTLND